TAHCSRRPRAARISCTFAAACRRDGRCRALSTGTECEHGAMPRTDSGVVAAGHPLTAQAGARVLREGGNAVDAAVAAMLTSFVAEPLLTGLGAGGYMLVGGGGREPALLDFFAQAPSRAEDGGDGVMEAIDV